MGARPHRLAQVTTAMIALAAVLPPPAGAGDDSSRRLTVMTRNLYVGSSYSHIPQTADPLAFIQGTTTFWSHVQQTSFRVRAEALAEEIEATDPDLIGLQEVSKFRIQVPRDPATPATEVALDYLQILRDELQERGLSYAVVSRVPDFDVEAPVLAGPSELIDVRLTDRDVVLARTDAPKLAITRTDSGNYDARVVITTPAGPLPTPRGWNAVDGRLDGERFRFVNTHLEPEDQPAVQVAQANELLNGPLATDPPVIAVGDYNSPADGSTTATYGLLRDAGFADAWSLLAPDRPGFTCCQPELLHNPVSALRTRIDLVLTRGGPKPKDVALVGNDPADRTAGLWPSDHAGVVATIRLRDDG
jgi:endonuclease/exonuclease/phosphatase family metal-dependent hydrolase